MRYIILSMIVSIFCVASDLNKPVYSYGLTKQSGKYIINKTMKKKVKDSKKEGEKSDKIALESKKS